MKTIAAGVALGLLFNVGLCLHRIARAQESIAQTSRLEVCLRGIVIGEDMKSAPWKEVCP